MEGDTQKLNYSNPGERIAAEIAMRGWMQRDLAHIMGRPISIVNEIIRGVRAITSETALDLEGAFNIPAADWLKWEAEYRLRLEKAKPNPRKDMADRKRRLYDLAPIGDMISRGWINGASDIVALEKQVLEFLRMDSFDAKQKHAPLCRSTKSEQMEVPALNAWACRVEQLAERQNVSAFDRQRMDDCLRELKTLTRIDRQIRDVPATLNKYGIRFVVVPHLARTYLDGATFPVCKNPVIALTLRFDRIDNFWHVLMHEFAHIFCQHENTPFDDTNAPQSEDSREVEADTLAAEWLLKDAEFKRFAQTTRPYFSRVKIERFAETAGRHPGIVLGRLHRQNEVEFKNLRALLVSVSPYLADWTHK